MLYGVVHEAGQKQILSKSAKWVTSCGPMPALMYVQSLSWLPFLVNRFRCLAQLQHELF
jgi:hypothetical protein